MAMPTNPETATTAQPPAVTDAAGAPIRASFHDAQGFALMQRVATALSKSTLVPQQYQNNMPNCLIAVDMAERLRASILMVAQNLYVVHGRPGWSSKFLIASFNQCGRFSAIRYEWVGERNTDEWGCRAWSTETKTGQRIEGPTITIALAKKEGWYNKSGSKWQTIPELMLMYRAAGWLVNTHAPEISMGLSTAEEIEDIEMTRGPGGTFGLASDNGGAEVADATASRQAQLRDKYAGAQPAEVVDEAETGELASDEALGAVNALIDQINEAGGDGFAELAKAVGDIDVGNLTAAQAVEAVAYLTGVAEKKGKRK